MYKTMSSTDELEKLYNERVKVDEARKKDFEGLIKYVGGVVIGRMEAQSPEFKAIYGEIHYRMSLFDDLKEDSSEQEFDLNIVLYDSGHGTYLKFYGDPKGKYFSFLKDSGTRFRPGFCGIDEHRKDTCIYPNLVFELMQRSVGQVLTDKGLELMYKGRTYLVTQKTPATLVIAVINGSRSCKVNLVPTFKLIRSMISRDQQQKVNDVCQQFGMCLPSPCYSSSFYMATALPDKLMFDLSEVEEWLVRSGDCLKKVIKLMEHMKKVKGSPLIKLSTRLLKVSSDGS